MSYSDWPHLTVSRRTAIQAGAVGILGLGMNHLSELQAAASVDQITGGEATAKSCIYIFLSGGLAQHDSFDLKPNAPANVRGEFKSISTSTPGIQICEHLPRLAERSVQSCSFLSCAIVAQISVKAALKLRRSFCSMESPHDSLTIHGWPGSVFAGKRPGPPSVMTEAAVLTTC